MYFLLLAAVAFPLLLPQAMPRALFRLSRGDILRAIESNEIDIVVGRASRRGAPTVFRLVMQGEPLALQTVRRNRTTRNWYDPLHFTKEAMKRRIRRELALLGEDAPVFPSPRRLKVAIVFVAAREKDIDNMLKPFLDVLQGLVYENDCVIDEIHARKVVLSRQAVTVPSGTAKIDVTINPM